MLSLFLHTTCIPEVFAFLCSNVHLQSWCYFIYGPSVSAAEKVGADLSDWAVSPVG